MRILLIDGQRRGRLESGYGRIASALAEGLPHHGHEIAFDLGGHFDLSFYTSPPFSMRKVHLPGAARVGFTMHESETLGEGKRDWPEILNALDLIFTPTEWNREVWQRLGVQTPIEVVPVGVDPNAYYPGTGHTCIFLAVHEALGEPQPHTREDWTETLRAYYTAFTAADDVVLRIKTWKWYPEEFEQARRSIATEFADLAEHPPVEIVDATLSHEQMRALYLESAMFVKNANREGWSIPCSEAVACGTPVAATDIPALRAHLSSSTRWFAVGDRQRLSDHLRDRYREFSAELRQRHRYTNAVMCGLVSEGLERHLEAEQG
jgi:glycosyltransferase involved in cell wall biosynthesis